MSQSILRRAATAAVALATAAVAQAGTLTTNGWLFGAGEAVKVAAPDYSGPAGGFSGTLSGMADERFNVGPLPMYCVDLGQTIDIRAGNAFSLGIAGDEAVSTFMLTPIEDVFDAAVARRLGRLVSLADSGAAGVDDIASSAALQLAIWNVVYDSDETLAAVAGSGFHDTHSAGGGRRAMADGLLAASAGQAISKDLYVLVSTTRQDQLIWLDAQSVPEPGSLALAGLALAIVVGGGGRRVRARRR